MKKPYNPQAQKLLSKGANDGNIDTIRHAISNGADIDYNDSSALKTAVKKGHIPCVAELLTISEMPEEDNLFQIAAENGQTEMLKFLLSNAKHGRSGINDALISASEEGHTECVRLLIPLSDPKHMFSGALRVAAMKGFGDCVSLLLPVSDPAAALKYMNKSTKTGMEIIVSAMQTAELLGKHSHDSNPIARNKGL